MDRQERGYLLLEAFDALLWLRLYDAVLDLALAVAAYLDLVFHVLHDFRSMARKEPRDRTHADGVGGWGGRGGRRRRGYRRTVVVRTGTSPDSHSHPGRD